MAVNLVTSLAPTVTLFFVLVRMATKKSFARARVTADKAKAAEKAQAVSKLQEALQLSDPPSESSTVDESHSPLDFPESDTPMAPPSDSEGVTAPRTCSRKWTVFEVSKSETSDVPVINKLVKKTGPKPKPKYVPKKSVASHKVPGTDSESDVSVVKPVVKPKHVYKHLCHSGG
jgi:hypothetical protein